ncbi:type II secretion system protein [Halonotius roseus]|uniref:Type II secretion system protein n=2 Tax=Halonotius roseus TaxID=2511997 RepID=A0A544QSQ5_9EURY|nr:type II secretion system protein [Halonotius roseus]
MAVDHDIRAATPAEGSNDDTDIDATFVDTSAETDGDLDDPVADPAADRVADGGDADTVGADAAGADAADADAAGADAAGTDAPSADAAAERLRTELAALIERYGITVDSRTFHALWYYLHRDFRGYGRLDPLLADDQIEDISCDGPDHPVFIYHETHADLETNVAFDPAALDDFVVRLAQQAGHHISVGDPLIEATLPDGSRAELSLGEEVTPHGSAFTIRQYAADPFTPIDLIERGTFDAAGLAYCWLCIEHNKSLLVAGGTAAGKTTTLNALSMFVPPGAKVVTIEDTRELTLAHDNWLAAVTREQLTEGTAIGMYDLLRSALRHRPEYLLVGEVRGEEAQTLFQAMNTGHTTLSTIHADSIETAVTRLENEPIGLPRTMVESLDLLAVQTQRRLGGQRVRRVERIAEIRGIDDRTGDLDYANPVAWQPQADSFTRSHSEVLDSIRAERGWEPADLQAELAAREQFLNTLWEQGVTDYREFTARLADYYVDDTEDAAEDADDTDRQEKQPTAATMLNSQSSAASPPGKSPDDASSTTASDNAADAPVSNTDAPIWETDDADDTVDQFDDAPPSTTGS